MRRTRSSRCFTAAGARDRTGTPTTRPARRPGRTRCPCWVTVSRKAPWTGPRSKRSSSPSRPCRRNEEGRCEEPAAAGMRPGGGVAMLPTFYVGPLIAAGKLVVLRPERKPLEPGIYAVYPQTQHVPPKVRAFVDFLVGHFGPKPAWDRFWPPRCLVERDDFLDEIGAGEGLQVAAGKAMDVEAVRVDDRAVRRDVERRDLLRDDGFRAVRLAPHEAPGPRNDAVLGRASPHLGDLDQPSVQPQAAQVLVEPCALGNAGRLQRFLPVDHRKEIEIPEDGLQEPPGE
ncbi:MAG: hypothetical protein IPL06_08770 [Betaproteobacteria bacterium]|nr:hypothetical protein [Betaproteobacteria bacterium]